MRLPAAMRSLIWPFIEAGTAVVAGAVAVLVIARLIGAEAFGSGSIALGIVLITQVIINSLVHDALIRSEQLPSEDVDVAFTATLIAAAIMGLLVAAMAPFVGLLLRHPHIAVYIWAFIPILFLGGLPVTLIAERRRALDFNTVAIHQIIGRFVGTALGLSAAWYGAGVWSLVIQYTCTGGYTAIAMYALAARYPRFRFSWTRLKPMLGFCSPIIGSQLGVHATTWLFLFAMGRFHGLVSAGHWSVATRIADSLFRGVMQAAYHVALARLALHQLARDRLRSALIKGQTLSGLAAIPLLVALAAAAEPVVQLLLGSSWAPAGRLAIGPLVAAFLLVRQMLPNTALRVIGKSSISLGATTLNATAAVAGLLLFGRQSTSAVSAVYALAMLPGYCLIYFAAAREFDLSIDRGAVVLGRDVAVAITAFVVARSVTAQFSQPSLLISAMLEGLTAFVAAAVLLFLVQLRALHTMLLVRGDGP